MNECYRKKDIGHGIAFVWGCAVLTLMEPDGGFHHTMLYNSAIQFSIAGPQAVCLQGFSLVAPQWSNSYDSPWSCFRVEKSLESFFCSSFCRLRSKQPGSFSDKECNSLERV